MKAFRRSGAAGAVALATGLALAFALVAEARGPTSPATQQTAGATAGAYPAFVPTPAPTAAVEVRRDEASSVFASSLDFALEAQGRAPIEDIVLHFTVGDEGPRNRRIPSFTPGSQVTATHTEQLVRGQIPPTSPITWWWTLTDTTGAELTTPPQTLTYLDEHFTWQSKDFPRARVWWYDDAVGPDAIGEAAADDLARVGKVVGHDPDRRVNIVAYASREDMLPALVARGDVYESRLATLGARVAPDVVLLLAEPGSGAVDETLAHELSHVGMHLAMSEPFIDAPLWLDEGLAMYMEGPLDGDEARDLKDALGHDQLMSVRSLTSFPGDASKVPLAYAESRDIVAFLLEDQGAERFPALVARLGSGEVTADGALEATYGFDQEGLYQAYRAARGLGAASTPTAGPAPSAPPKRGGPCGSLGLVPLAFLLAGASSWGRRRGGAARP